MIILKGYFFAHNDTISEDPACIKLDIKLIATDFTVERSENNSIDCQVKNTFLLDNFLANSKMPLGHLNNTRVKIDKTS